MTAFRADEPFDVSRPAPTSFPRQMMHVRAGGTPGSGKSAPAHALVAHLPLDPRVSLRLCDGKNGIELAGWAPAADA